LNSVRSPKAGLPVPMRALLGTARLYLKGWFLGDAQARDVLRWRKVRGDQTLRLDYALSVSDVVFDLGGYIGDFAAAIHLRHGCIVYVFEPVKKYFFACQERFAGNEKIKCFNFGLSSSHQAAHISLDGDASSIARDMTGHFEAIELESFDVFLRRFGIHEVALLKINIEGGEFDVLEHLIETGHISRMRHLQIQFHDFAEDATVRRNRIRAALARTHRLDWNFHFVWESWSRL
jgi:FkbM family methyltransferase